ncbi:hypothetical protein KU306_01315 [Haloferax larsenii]|uniref:Uncharacterized protein n=2 Tax=Haloferax TaxID=2251 RepID=A0ABY5REI8_HALLR|nr:MULTISPECIES: hypothetical protein [Haloferax]ELZ78128.1 hypothetical protein C455_10613 [Haloferax larsenii JCM 13917]ELZ82612.1 hypothetical protein C453_16043 [Haloferax elongans ATCC BAA-1513]UVE50574.1 hypothetical protein KU306_01315 [Haloferax larsenii]
MLLVRGHGGGTALTGTIFERGEEAPSYRGAPDEDAPYVWVCDEFYEVESGGTETTIDGQKIRVAFDTPLPRGFDTREQAITAAKEHIRTQFARVGVASTDVRIEVIRPEDEGDAAA